MDGMAPPPLAEEPKKFDGDLQTVDRHTPGLGDFDGIDGTEAQPLIEKAERELVKAIDAKEAAVRASRDAQSEEADAAGEAKTAETAKNTAIYHAARAIVYAKVAQEKAKAPPAANA